MLRFFGKRGKILTTYHAARIFGPGYYVFDGIRLSFATAYHHQMAKEAARGIIEPHFMNIWKEQVKKSSRIYDIGGFNGLFGLIAAKTNPRASVTIFEPDPINVSHIKRNIELNTILNCIVEEVALSNRHGTAQFDFGGTTYSLLGRGKDTVLCKMLSDYPPADLIKIDAGNSEADIIDGGKGAIASQKPFILMQTHSSVNHEHMFEQLKKVGYKTEHLGKLPGGGSHYVFRVN